VNPKAGTVMGAKLWEALINYYWRKLRTKEQVELEIIDKDLVGFGWHKVGRNVETEGAEEDLKISKDELYSRGINWRDVVYNLGVGEAKDVPYGCVWMAHRITKPIQFVRAKYKAAGGKSPLKGTKSPDIDNDVYKNSQFKDDIEVAVLWEIWDRESRKIYLIAEGLQKKFLAPPKDWPESIEEFPFMYYWDSHAPGMERPMSAILPWEPQVWEKMVLLGAAVNHSKRWNRQLLIKTGSMSKSDLDKLERGDDGAILEYQGTGELDKNMTKLDWGTLPVDFYLLMDRFSSIQREVSGMPEFAMGGVTKTSTRTDGELDKIAAGAKGRTDRRVDRFETHLENIARHMLMHLKDDFDFDEAIKITGWAPEELLQALGTHFDPVNGTITFSAEEISGDYDVEIKAGSTLPLNREVKGKIIDTLIQTLGNVNQEGVSPMLNALITERLDEFDIKSLKEAYSQEQQLKDQEEQRKSQEVNATEAKAKSQAAKNIASSDKISAEADALRLTHPFAPGIPSEPHPPEQGQGQPRVPEPPRVSLSFKSELRPDEAVEFAETGQVRNPSHTPFVPPQKTPQNGSGGGE
jgi:hypothetical protein